MIKKFEEFVNESYGKEGEVLAVRELENGQTIADITPEEFAEMMLNDFRAAYDEYKSKNGNILKSIRWYHPTIDSSVYYDYVDWALNNRTQYAIDRFKKCHVRNVKNTYYFPISTGWSIVDDGNRQGLIVFHTSEEAIQADSEKAHAKPDENDVFKFYRGTKYFGD